MNKAKQLRSGLEILKVIFNVYAQISTIFFSLVDQIRKTYMCRGRGKKSGDNSSKIWRLTPKIWRFYKLRQLHTGIAIWPTLYPHIIIILTFYHDILLKKKLNVYEYWCSIFIFFYNNAATFK